MPCWASMAACALLAVMSWRYRCRSTSIEALIASMIASGPDAKRPPHILLLMTPSPNPTGMKQTPFFSRFRFMPAAFILGAVAGLAVVYGIVGFQRNAGVDPVCRPAMDLGKKLEPLFKGEIAALTPAKTPIRPDGLSFRDGAGKERTLADWKDRVVLLNLWATW